MELQSNHFVLMVVSYTTKQDFGPTLRQGEVFTYPNHLLAREKLVQLSKLADELADELDDQSCISVSLAEMLGVDLVSRRIASGTCQQVLRAQAGWMRDASLPL